MIEYSDFPDDVAERRDADGALDVLGRQHRGPCVRPSTFLERALEAQGRAAVPRRPQEGAVRRRPRRAGRADASRTRSSSSGSSSICCRTPRTRSWSSIAEDEVFAPLKNAPGADRDTPEYVQQFMCDQHRRWLEGGGREGGRRRAGRNQPALGARCGGRRGTHGPARIDRQADVPAR